MLVQGFHARAPWPTDGPSAVSQWVKRFSKRFYNGNSFLEINDYLYARDACKVVCQLVSIDSNYSKLVDNAFYMKKQWADQNVCLEILLEEQAIL